MLFKMYARGIASEGVWPIDMERFLWNGEPSQKPREGDLNNLIANYKTT